jgi:phage terminase small subunit
MPAKSKARINSASEAVRIIQGATRELQPPSHVPLDDMDWPYWHSVVAEFARAEWTEHQLELAAMLARTMANLEQEQRSIRAEGFVSVRENGTVVDNPRSRIIAAMTTQILALRRSLALHARARSGDTRADAVRKAAGKDIETDIEDELLARPE